MTRDSPTQATPPQQRSADDWDDLGLPSEGNPDDFARAFLAVHDLGRPIAPCG